MLISKKTKITSQIYQILKDRSISEVVRTFLSIIITFNLYRRKIVQPISFGNFKGQFTKV